MTRQEKIDKIRSVCDMLQQYQSECGYIVTFNGEIVTLIRNLPEDVTIRTAGQSVFLVKAGADAPYDNIDYADQNDKAFKDFMYRFQVYAPINPVWAN